MPVSGIIMVSIWRKLKNDEEHQFAQTLHGEDSKWVPPDCASDVVSTCLIGEQGGYFFINKITFIY